MLHSIKHIAKKYSELSSKRNDKKLFSEDDFIQFAETNKEEYSLIEDGDDFLIGTWYFNDLVSKYRNTL